MGRILATDGCQQCRPAATGLNPAAAGLYPAVLAPSPPSLSFPKLLPPGVWAQLCLARTTAVLGVPIAATQGAQTPCCGEETKAGPSWVCRWFLSLHPDLHCLSWLP